MKKKIWFIGRNYPPQVLGGGAITRKMQVEFLQKYYDVEVVTVNYKSKKLFVKDNIHFVPEKWRKKLKRWAVKFGLAEELLFDWVKKTKKYLKNKVKKGDVFFATTGGELSCIKLASLLKKDHPETYFIANYHDLLDAATYFGQSFVTEKKDMDKLEKKYLSNCDFLFANSITMKKMLSKKLHFLKEKVDS